jgi:outer membrane autotransporter protein
MVLREKETQDGRQKKVWVRASYQREFCGKNKIDVAGDEAMSGGGRNIYQLNAGASFDLTRHFSICGDISKNFGDEHGYRGSLSLKSVW